MADQMLAHFTSHKST